MIFVADKFNHAVRVITSDNQVTTVAGTGTAVQGRVGSAGDPAPAGEESVAHAGLPGDELARQRFHATHDDTRPATGSRGAVRPFVACLPPRWASGPLTGEAS